MMIGVRTRTLAALSAAAVILPLVAATCAESTGDQSAAASTSVGAGGGAGSTGSGVEDAGFDGFDPGDAPSDVPLGDGCASATVEASVVPLDMVILLDRSSSMTSNGKWDVAVKALKGFADSGSVAGLGLGLQYFPPAAGDACSPTTYKSLAVPLATLPDNAGAIKVSLESAAPTGSNTPMRPGLEGALQYMTSYLADNPTHEGVVILVTDGNPTGCTNNAVSNVASIASDAFAADPPVRTFVIGMEGATFANLDTIADAGGTKKAFNVGVGAAAQLALVEALEEVRAQALSCEFILPIPDPKEGTLDLDSVVVEFTPGLNEDPVSINKVESFALCGEISGGFYYDNAINPERIVLCPASCELVKSGTKNASVRVVLGCIEPPPS